MLFCLCQCLLSLSANAGEKKTEYIYHYWDLRASEKRDAYQYQLLNLALQKTLPTHGKYVLTKNNERFTSLRSRRELERGELINVVAFAARKQQPSANETYSSLVITRPLLRGLLGYRKLIVRRNDLPKFLHISSAAELQQLSAGQGRDWHDIDIYKYNNYSVVDSADYFNLFAMLASGRFDYIPLSAIEIEDNLARFAKYSQEFVVVPNLMIYYPFTVYYNLSARQPKLRDRLEEGLSRAEADGSLQQLFERYFSKELEKLRAEHVKVFVLKNPEIASSLGLDKPILLQHYQIIQ